MVDKRDEKWEQRADKAYDDLTYRPARTILKWFLATVAVCVMIALVFGVISWIGSWGSTAARLTGPQHTEQQTTAVLDDWTSLKAIAGNACDAASTSQPGDPTLVERPDFAYRAKYRQVEADYDRRMNNLFEAAITRHIPLPDTIHNLPRMAPTLHEQESQVC